jgi:5S rRNA maturation endonuclease (ribonuclease M5)
MFPLNFYEFLEMKKFRKLPINENKMEEFNEYIRYGGFPKTLEFINNDDKDLYVKSVIEQIIDKDIVNLVERLTSGIWTSQKQNLFLASHDDILIVEGPTDETFITAALNYFKKNGRYTNLSFEFIPCGGASNVKAFAQKFKPKDGQTVIALFDGDDAGVKSMNQVVPCTLGKKMKWDIKNFGKARKNKYTWFSFYPPYARRRNIKNFNVEDYFTCQLFRKYILSFTSLDTISGKETLKRKLDEDCKEGKIDDKFYDKFSALFDHIVAIKEADRHGKDIIN